MTRTLDARVLDSSHLELLEPLRLHAGRRVTVRIETTNKGNDKTRLRRERALATIQTMFSVVPKRRSLSAELLRERRREARHA